MTKMTTDEKQAFLAGLHVGVVGLNDPESGPLTVPIWYDYEPGSTVWMITGKTSMKGKLLGVGNRVSLVAQTETAPYQYVSVEGPVLSIEQTTTEELLAMATRYLGEEQGKAYYEASGVENQITIRIQPQRWLAVDYSRR